MFPISDVETCQKLFECMPISMCRVDAENVITWANVALGKRLDRDLTALVGHRAEELFVSSDEASAFVATIREQGSVTGTSVRLHTTPPGIWMALASAYAMLRPDGGYDGWVGLLEEDHKRILDCVPAGIYEILSDNGGHRLAYCNREFARLLGFSSEREAQGRDMREFYPSEGGYPAFLTRLRGQADQGRPLRDDIETLRTQQGGDKEVQISACLVRDCCDHETGCVGVIQDITDERQLRAQIDDLREDVGRVFHTFASPLHKVRHAAHVALVSAGSGPGTFEEEPSIDEVNAALVEPVAHLRDALQALIAAIEADWRERGLNPRQWDELCRYLEMCQDYKRIVPIPEQVYHTLRLTARTAIDFLDGLDRRRLPNVPIKTVRGAALEVERVVSLALLWQAESEIIDMDTQVRSFRSYVASGPRAEGEKVVVEFWSLVSQALDRFFEYAQAAGVEYRPRNETRGIRVSVIESDVVRALGNLVHNAIKYSWSRRDGRPPWVTVQSFVEDAVVGVAFENRGVPIPKEEIEEGLIFRLGYRGRLSGDRGRLGTGIGLTDARQTARRHGGEVKVESRPAWRDAEPGDYSVPYITTVTYWLPVHSG